MTEENFNSLNAKVDNLIAQCTAMQKENQMLKANQHVWNNERQQLIAKNKEAKARLQSILVRLKGLGDF
ncbi:MAG: TIGR02449 family protein [Gammaproteobacteria bacterium]|nr:TIGR02449 family protein [Gammaproteobacteria bacterium]